MRGDVKHRAHLPEAAQILENLRGRGRFRHGKDGQDGKGGDHATGIAENSRAWSATLGHVTGNHNNLRDQRNLETSSLFIFTYESAGPPAFVASSLDCLAAAIAPAVSRCFAIIL